jgi:hypothetical protein
MGYEEFKNEIENYNNLQKIKKENMEKKVKIESKLNGKEDSNNSVINERITA